MHHVVLGHAGVLKPGKLQWLRAIAWMILLLVVVVLAFNLVGHGIMAALALAAAEMPAAAAALPQSLKLVATIVAVMAALMLYWAAVRLGEKRPASELFLNRLIPDFAAGLAIGAGLMAIIIGVLAACDWVRIEVASISAISRALRESIQSGVIEEVMFRLIIFRLLWRAWGVWPALGIAASLFGAAHLANPDADFFAALSIVAGEGVGFGLFLLTGRAWASVGAHAGWNFTQGWIFGAAVSGTEGIAGGPLATRAAQDAPHWLSGGGFGPEASAAALVVSLIASFVFLHAAWTRGDFRARDEEIIQRLEPAADKVA